MIFKDLSKSGGLYIMLKGKRALVTGGSRGNGKGIAEGLLDYGAEVVVFDLDEGTDSNIKYYQVDLTDREALGDTYHFCTKENGIFDVLINNAGVTFGKSSQDYEEDKWRRTLEINLTVPFLLSQMFAKDLIRDEREGSIINITSLGAEFGFPENPAYCASKGGLKQLTKALAYDWAQYGIRVNNVGPGYMHTNMTDKSYNDPGMHGERLRHMMIKRWGEPKDLVGVCVFLASEMSGYITGQDIYVDGGWTAKGI